MLEMLPSQLFGLEFIVPPRLISIFGKYSGNNINVHPGVIESTQGDMVMYNLLSPGCKKIVDSLCAGILRGIAVPEPLKYRCCFHISRLFSNQYRKSNENPDVNDVIFLQSYITLIRAGMVIIGVKDFLTEYFRSSITISGAGLFFLRAGIY